MLLHKNDIIRSYERLAGVRVRETAIVLQLFLGFFPFLSLHKSRAAVETNHENELAEVRVVLLDIEIGV